MHGAVPWNMVRGEQTVLVMLIPSGRATLCSWTVGQTGLLLEGAGVSSNAACVCSTLRLSFAEGNTGCVFGQGFGCPSWCPVSYTHLTLPTKA